MSNDEKWLNGLTGQMVPYTVEYECKRFTLQNTTILHRPYILATLYIFVVLECYEHGNEVIIYTIHTPCILATTYTFV